MDRMTWIHANEDLDEQRELIYISSADMEVNTATDAELVDNSWSMKISEREWEKNPIRVGHYVYAPGTEWGGPVTLIKHETSTRSVTLQGPTWRGMLFQRRIEPPEGEAYLVYRNTDANEILADLIDGLYGGLFAVDDTPAGVTVSAQFRYQTVANGASRAMRSAGLRMALAYNNATKTVAVTSTEAGSGMDGVELSQDYGIQFTSTLGNLEYANHCLILGSGELTERTVINLYRDSDGSYTTVRPEWLTEELLRTVALDYPNAEDTEELMRSAAERLDECGEGRSFEIDTQQAGITLELGDEIAIRDRMTGMTARAEVRRKILTIQEGRIKIQDGVTTIGIDPEEDE